MSSEIRANTLKNRVGLGTVSFTNTGPVVSGIVTANGLELNSVDAGSSAGPELKLFRNSASPADADYLGQLKFAGESDTGVERNYAKITGKILDASNGTEDGILEFAHIKGGSQTITGRWRSDSLQLLNGTSLTVAGDTTLTGDIDVDGHTNLDNGNVAGIVTFNSGAALHMNGGQILLYDRPDGNSNNLFFGTGGKAVIFHDGTNFSQINNTGHFYLGVGVGNKDLMLYAQASGNVLLQQNTGVRYVKGVGSDASVQLFFNNNLRLNTTNAGVSIPKDLDVDGHTNLDNVSIAGVTTFTGVSDHSSRLQMLAGNPIRLLNDANSAHCEIDCYGGAGFRLTSYNQNMFTCENGSSTKFYTDSGTSRLEITNGGDVLVVTGTLHIPDALQHYGDTDTKIRFPANDTISFETAGSERLRITSGGSVEIDRGSASDVALSVDTTSTTNACRIAFNESGTRKAEIAYSHDNDQIEVIGKSGQAAAIFTDSATRLAITSGGHVNIGGNYTSTTYGFSVRGGAVDQSTRFSNTKSSNGDIHYIGISLTNNGFGQALFGHTGHTTAGSQAAWMGLAGDDVAGGTGVKCFRGGKVQMGASSTLQAFINNSVSGHQFISQCSDNNNGFEIYQKHGSTATRKTLAVYANTGNSAAKQIQFEVRGDNTTHAYGTKNTSPFTLSTAIGPSGAHSYGDENRLDFLMYNEIPQFTGNPAARIAGYLQRGNNGFGLRFYARTNASTLFKAMEITADYEVLPGINGSVDLGSSSYRWKNVYTSDLDLSNEAKGGNDVDGTWGSYTIQEGESDLFLINKRNGKKYKFNLTEVS